MSSIRAPWSAAGVDARLDREAHAGRKRRVVAVDDPRLLVLLEADPMTGAMDEQLAVPGGGDDVASRGIDLLAR